MQTGIDNFILINLFSTKRFYRGLPTHAIVLCTDRFARDNLGVKKVSVPAKSPSKMVN
jgi:hypothetical protein